MNKVTASAARRGFIYHLHPPKMAAASIDFSRTFGLGGMALVLFTLLLITGMLLRLPYVPTPSEAYDSIVYINNGIAFGGFVRNIHYWSGIFFVIVTFLHFVRVFYAQAIFVPRRVNWIIGLALLVLAILSNFTGYLLPWDQLSYWAVTVATSMVTYIPLVGEWLLSVIRGGDDVASATLLNFYNFHTGILPVAMVLLMIWHFWKVRKAKGVAVPEALASERVPANPHLLLKELVVGSILLAIIFMLAALFDAPLLERANPAFSPNPAKAPWYFMGIQELLLHIHPFFAFIVLPFFFFAGLIWLPFAVKTGNQGTWFHSGRGKKLSVQAAVLALVLTPVAVILEEYILHFEGWLPALPEAVSGGLIPVLLLLASFGIYLWFILKKYRPEKHELIIALFTIFIVSYLVLTVIGIWFRGEGMQLMWPWRI